MREWINIVESAQAKPEVLNEFSTDDAKEIMGMVVDGTKEVAKSLHLIFQLPRLMSGAPSNDNEYISYPMFNALRSKYGMIVRCDENEDEDDLAEYVEELEYVAGLLKKEGLGDLLKGRYYLGDFYYNSWGSKRSEQVRGLSSGSTIYLTVGLADWTTILHELGHKLNNSMVLTSSPKLIKKYNETDYDDEEWFVTEYSKTNFSEMFAELFEEYFTGNLAAGPKAWIKKFIDRYKWFFLRF